MFAVHDYLLLNCCTEVFGHRRAEEATSCQGSFHRSRSNSLFLQPAGEETFLFVLDGFIQNSHWRWVTLKSPLGENVTEVYKCFLAFRAAVQASMGEQSRVSKTLSGEFPPGRHRQSPRLWRRCHWSGFIRIWLEGDRLLRVTCPARWNLSRILWMNLMNPSGQEHFKEEGKPQRANKQTLRLTHSGGWKKNRISHQCSQEWEPEYSYCMSLPCGDRSDSAVFNFIEAQTTSDVTCNLQQS